MGGQAGGTWGGTGGSDSGPMGGHWGGKQGAHGAGGGHSRSGAGGAVGAACPDPLPVPVPVAGLKQELFHRHKEAQQCCRPHNLPLLRAAQQREMEVRGGRLARGCAPFPGG